MKVFHLIHSEARRNALQCVQEAPEGYAVRVSEPKRNLEQNALLHALLTDIAETREWCGKKWDMETWKRLMIAAWSRAEGAPIPALPSLDGHGMDLVYRPSSSMTKAEMVSLIDYVQAWHNGGAV